MKVLPQPPYSRLVVALGYGGFAAWMGYILLAMSWAGHRPLLPDPASGAVIPFNDHGILYVTQRDLDTSHALLALTALLLIAALVIDKLEKRKGPHA